MTTLAGKATTPILTQGRRLSPPAPLPNGEGSYGEPSCRGADWAGGVVGRRRGVGLFLGFVGGLLGGRLWRGGRWGAVGSQDSYVVHQVVERCIDVVQFGLQVRAVDLADIVAAEFSDIRLHLVEERVELVDAAGDFLVLVLVGEHVVRRLEDFVGGPIGVFEAGVLRIVDVQVEAQFVRLADEQGRQVGELGEFAELVVDRLGGDAGIGVRWRRGAFCTLATAFGSMANAFGRLMIVVWGWLYVKGLLK